ENYGYFDGNTEIVEDLIPKKGYWTLDEAGLPIKYVGLDKPTENTFLQLLNKDSNWVTFFIKSIIQDSTRKGYEKILIPLGDTASKIEGHDDIEEFIESRKEYISSLEAII